MGDTVSTLVFRPPRPTYLKPTRYFFLDVNQDNPLTTSSSLSCVTTNSSAVSCTSTNGSLSSSSSGQPPPPTGGRHRIPAFFIKRRDAKLTILFSHGNAEDLGMMHDRMKALSRELNVNVMCYEYTGYGYSTGSPSEEMCYRNIEAAYNYVRNMLGIPASQIVLYGRSLGSGPSCYLAAKTAMEGESVAGLILHSPFLSIYRIVVNSANLGVVGDMFPNGRRASDIRCPVLLVHGTQDEIVPFSHGLELLNNIRPEYRTRPFWAEGLGHNNIEVFLRHTFLERCRHFFDQYVVGAQDNEGGQPLTVPVEEQAVIDQSDLSEHQFYINPTWVAYGKKVLNQAMGSSQRSGLYSRASSSLVESRDDGEDGAVDEDCNDVSSPRGGGNDENWGRDGNVREDWPAYDNVRTVPVSLMRSISRITGGGSEKRDEAEEYDDDDDDEGVLSDEDHSTYFHTCDRAIADVAGGDMSRAFVDDIGGGSYDPYGAEFDKRYSGKKDNQHHFFKPKKGRKLFGRSRSKGASFCTS